MNVYSIDVKIVGTAYVKANSPDEALQKVVETYGDQPGTGIEVGESEDISGDYLQNDELPDISLSPAMTVTGPCSTDLEYVELQEEGVCVRLESRT